MNTSDRSCSRSACRAGWMLERC